MITAFIEGTAIIDLQSVQYRWRTHHISTTLAAVTLTIGCMDVAFMVTAFMVVNEFDLRNHVADLKSVGFMFTLITSVLSWSWIECQPIR